MVLPSPPVLLEETLISSHTYNYRFWYPNGSCVDLKGIYWADDQQTEGGMFYLLSDSGKSYVIPPGFQYLEIVFEEENTRNEQ